jgi:hypothetical protein
LIRPLRDLGAEFDTFAMVPATALSRLHMDPEGPTPDKGDGMMLSHLTAEAVEAFVGSLGPSLVSVELRHLGGALGRPAPGSGVMELLDGGFALFAVAITPTEEAYRAAEADVTRVLEAMDRWSSARSYFNFTTSPTGAGAVFNPFAYRRLQQIRAQYDPAELIHAAHAVPPAS